MALPRVIVMSACAALALAATCAAAESTGLTTTSTRTVQAVRLADGERAWPGDMELPAGSLPSGRGFYSGNYYYLPLNSAEVAKINLDTGTIEARARSRSGTIPGNLVCYQGSIISQSADYVDAYYQLDVLKKQIDVALEKQPDDPKALAGLADFLTRFVQQLPLESTAPYTAFMAVIERGARAARIAK